MTAPLCKNCKERHYGSCPLWDRKPVFTPLAEAKEKVIEAPKVKKPWVKPTLTRWVKAVDTSTKDVDKPSISVDTAKDSVAKVKAVDKDVDKKEARRKAQREWVKKKRAKNG